MTAPALVSFVDDLRRKGVVLTREGGNIRARPARALTPEIVERLRQAKPALLVMLSAAPSGPAWDAADWKQFFEERAAVGEHDHHLSRPEAEARALEWCLARWLADNPPTPTDPGRGCAHCGKPEAPSAVVLPFLAGNSGHIWLHGLCWPAWHARRRAEAVKALAAVGLGPGR